jgi:hypothetical protein
MRDRAVRTIGCADAVRGTSMNRRPGAVLRAAIAFGLLAVAMNASAQELEPGAYWPIPVGLNIATVVDSYNWGDLAFDPSGPIDEASAEINTTAFALTRAFNIAGRSSNVGIVLPVVVGHVEGLYLGNPAEVDRFGLGDPRLRIAILLHGAPAMTPREFATYRHDLIVGVSASVAPPLGEYDPAKLINIGTHRWSFKPEVGISKAIGHWVVEAMAGVWLFTDNTNFAGGRTREQDPIGAMQAHLTYKFKRSMWLAADANYYTGGQSSIGGTRNADLQRNSRVGTTFSWALDRHHSVRASLSQGAVTSIGADFTSIAVGYNYVWAW